VFADEANANHTVDVFAEAGFPSYVWKRDGMYHVFSGIADTRAQADNLADELNKGGMEVYVKEWATQEAELQLNEKENEWLESVRSQWYTSLQSIGKEGAAF